MQYFWISYLKDVLALIPDISLSLCHSPLPYSLLFGDLSMIIRLVDLSLKVELWLGFHFRILIFWKVHREHSFFGLLLLLFEFSWGRGWNPQPVGLTCRGSHWLASRDNTICGQEIAQTTEDYKLLWLLIWWKTVITCFDCLPRFPDSRWSLIQLIIGCHFLNVKIYLTF